MQKGSQSIRARVTFTWTEKSYADDYQNYLRKDSRTFDKLVSMIKSKILKQDIIMRLEVQAIQKVICLLPAPDLALPNCLILQCRPSYLYYKWEFPDSSWAIINHNTILTVHKRDQWRHWLMKLHNKEMLTFPIEAPINFCDFQSCLPQNLQKTISNQFAVFWTLYLPLSFFQAVKFWSYKVIYNVMKKLFMIT